MEQNDGHIRLQWRPQRGVGLADQVYALLLGAIDAGAYSSGERLPSESELSRSYGVSRPILREALMRLKADGFVVSRQGAGTFVARRPPDKLMALARVQDVARYLRTYEIRSALEGQGAWFCALRRTEKELAEIEAAHRDLLTALSVGAAAAKLDFAFHRSVAKSSGNDLFVELLDALNELVIGGMSLGVGVNQEVPPASLNRIAEEHTRILEAVQACEPESAKLAMQYHIDQAKRRLTDRARAQS